jgi:hypothetical protein
MPCHSHPTLYFSGKKGTYDCSLAFCVVLEPFFPKNHSFFDFSHKKEFEQATELIYNVGFRIIVLRVHTIHARIIIIIFPGDLTAYDLFNPLDKFHVRQLESVLQYNRVDRV